MPPPELSQDRIQTTCTFRPRLRSCQGLRSAVTPIRCGAIERQLGLTRIAGKSVRVLPRCCPKRGECQGSKNRAKILGGNQTVAGAPEEIRTPDPQIRSL